MPVEGVIEKMTPALHSNYEVYKSVSHTLLHVGVLVAPFLRNLEATAWRAPFTSYLTRLPDGYSQIFSSYVFGPSGIWTMAPLRYAAKFDPILSLDCAPRPPAWHNPRKGRDQILPSGNLAILTELMPQSQPCTTAVAPI